MNKSPLMGEAHRERLGQLIQCQGAGLNQGAGLILFQCSAPTEVLSEMISLQMQGLQY